MTQTIIASKLETILKKVQICQSAHQKNLKCLEQLYLNVEYNDFVHVLCTYLKKKLFPIKNEFVERILSFLAQFIASMTPDEDIEDDSTQPFLRDIVSQTLMCHDVESEMVRYNACLFIRLILQNFTHSTRLDNDICDLIQEAMLERTNDPKPSIRQQAVMAMIRLQDPFNPECPIIKVYLSLFVDSNSSIRAEVVKNIAPYSLTIPHIINRLRDIDTNVRIMALRRCADLGPKHFKIVERQHIINCGLTENQPKVKKVFVDNLIMKWLNVYQRNIFEFLRSLKLDADENDIINTEEISKEVLTLIIKSIPIKEIINALSLENKLVSLKNLTTETATIWNVVVNFLRQSSDMEEFLDDILPELTPFCDYIDRVIKKNNATSPMDDWEYLSYQCIMYNLFEIVEKYDFSDEVGRQRLNQLLLTILRDEELEYRLLKKIVTLAEQLKSKHDSFIDIICHLISEIREPLIEQTVPTEKNYDNSFQKAQIKVKINILECELEDATDMQEFIKANSLKEEIIKLKEDLKNLMEPEPVVEVVKVSKDDPKTICRCLDLLIALLELSNTTKLTTYLISVKDEFVLPLLNNSSSEVNWRVLNCLGLYCLLDQGLAEEYIKIILIPIITYRAIPNYDRQALTTSVKAMSDLYRTYGVKIFGNSDNISQNSITLNSTKRRLYRNDAEEDAIDPNRFHYESSIEIMLDMLDDENSDIRNCAVLAISKLILSNFPVTPLFITRILLKWYNPLTARLADNVQQILGVLIANYANSIKGAREVISKAVVPILTSISSAPRTSPLSDVDVDNMLQFLAAITNSGNKRDVVNIHLNLAHILCHEISKKKESPVIILFTKMLLYLDIPLDNGTALNEIISQVQSSIEEEAVDKLPKRYLLRFLEKINDLLKQQRELSLETINEGNTENNDENNKQAADNLSIRTKEPESDYNVDTDSSNTTKDSVHPRVATEPNEKNNSCVNQVDANQDENRAEREIDENLRKRHREQDDTENTTEQLEPINVNESIDNLTNIQQKCSSHDTNSENLSSSTSDIEILKSRTSKRIKIAKNHKNDANKIQDTPSQNNIRNCHKHKNNHKGPLNEKIGAKRSNREKKRCDLNNQSKTDTEDTGTTNGLKKTRNHTNNSSSSDSDASKENKRKNICNGHKAVQSQTDNNSPITKNLRNINTKRKSSGPVKSNNDTADSDSASPKRKKLKTLSVNLKRNNYLKGVNNQNAQKIKRLTRNTSDTLGVCIEKNIKITEMQTKNVDHTMNFTNFTLSNSLKPVIESTTVDNEALGSSVTKSQSIKRGPLSKRTSIHRKSNMDTSEETILHTIQESFEVQTSDLSVSSLLSSKNFVSERSLRSRSISLSSTPSSSPKNNSPIIKMPRISSKTSETGSHEKRPTRNTKKKF